MRVLIVDDDDTTLRLLTMLVQRRGHSVQTAQDGEQAWARFQEGGHALILLDWLLPGTDGVAVCRRMRAHPGGDQPVILMVTAQDQPRHLLEMLDAGADDYLPKPIEPVQFSIRMTIAERRAEQRAEYHKASTELARRRSDSARLGADIQRTFLLGHPPAEFPGVDIASSVAPAQEVSGDFFDFWANPDAGTLDVAVGDVVGKGVPAALLGAAVKGQLVRTLAGLAVEPGHATGPLAIVDRVKRAMIADLRAVAQFFTLAYARIDVRARKLTLVSCGHPAVLRRSATGRCDYLPVHNAPVGLEVPDDGLVEHVIALEPEDRLVFYSDGVTEVRRGGTWEGDELGAARLAALVQEHGGAQAAPLMQAIQSAVAAHSAPAAPSDDVTVVVVRLTA